MTVTEIQASVAMYLQKSVAKFDVTGTGANLILTAMNNARKYAERRHNWSMCRQKGYLSVTTGNEVAWDSPTWFDGGVEKMKEGKHWWLRQDSTDVTTKRLNTDKPIKVIQHGVKHVVETQQAYVPYGRDATWQEDRYQNTEGYCSPLLGQDHAVIRGKWLELYPIPTQTRVLVVDGYKWWNNWVGSSRASVVIQDYVASSLYQFADIADGDLLNVRITEPGGGEEVVQFEFDNDATTTPGNVVITMPATLASIAAAINGAGFDGGDVATVVDSTVVISTAAAGASARVTMTYYSTATSGFTLIKESVGSSADTTDWWTENAAEYLILRSMVEANRLGMIFTGNKEGNLAPPEKQAEILLQDLINQDCGGEMGGGQIEQY